MKREHFIKVVGEALDSLPQEFRSRIQNVAVLVEDVPPNQPSLRPGSKGNRFWVSSTVCPN
jgi:predicted Zn-dependent protease with MMP-like domain